MKIVVRATLDSKFEAAIIMCDVLRSLGVKSWLLDLSLKPHVKVRTDICEGTLATTQRYVQGEMRAKRKVVGIQD
jgi:uncharacterized protein (UPF0261 family)